MQVTLQQALIQVESGGDDNAVGDKNLANHAYGCLQIREPVCIDVNRVYGTEHHAQDMLGNRSLSLETFERYMAIYATQKRLGRAPTDQDRARIWNGGPNGYRLAATLGYWAKVQRAMQA